MKFNHANYTPVTKVIFYSFISAFLLLNTSVLSTSAAVFPFVGSSNKISNKKKDSVESKAEKNLTGNLISASVSLDPNEIGPGNITTLNVNINNPSSSPVTDIAFSLTLPASVTIADVPNETNNLQGNISAMANGSTITFSDGILPPSGSGQVKVDLTSSTIGIHTIPSITVFYSNGSTQTLATDLTVITSRPGFSMAFSPDAVNLGQRTTLTYTIDNTLNPSRVGNLDFTNNLPAGLVIASPANVVVDGILDPQMANSITAMPGTNTVILDANGSNFFPGFEVLSAGAIGTLSVDVVPIGIGNLDNRTTLLADFIDVGKASDRLQVTRDRIAIQMSFTDDPIAPGSTANLQVTISNFDRDDTATDLSFTLDLDAVIPGLVATGLPQNDVVGKGSTLSGTSVITLTNGTVPAGDSATFDVTLQTSPGSATGNFPATTSSLTGNLGGISFTSNPASDTLFIQTAPILTMNYINDPLNPGEVATLEFSITNSSATSAASDIEFDVNLPNIIATADNPPSSVCNGGTLTFTQLVLGSGGSATTPANISVSGATLAAGASCTFAVDLNVDENAPGGDYPTMTSNITATVDSESVSGQPAADELQIIAIPSLSMSFDDPVIPGATTTLNFTLEHSENASTDATNISFTIDLGAALSGLTAVGLPNNDICGTGSQISGTTVLSFTGGILSPGTNCSFSVTLQIPAAATTGSYTVTSSDVSANVGGNFGTRQGASDNLDVVELTTSATFTNSPTVAGGLLNLEFTLENQSATEDATNIFFTANLSSIISGLAAEPPLPVEPCGSGSSITGTTFLIFSGGNLTAGSSCTFSINVRVPANASVNTYSFTTSNVTASINGGTVVLPPMTAQFSVIQPLDLQMVFPDGPAMSDGNTTLRFTIVNTDANVSLTNIAFTDDLDAMLSGLVATTLPSMPCGAGSSITGTSTLTFTGGSLAPSGSCTFDVTLQIPNGAATGTYTNTTSTPTADVNGTNTTADPGSADLTIVDDSAAPTLSYTPLANTNSTADQQLRVDVTDSTGVASVDIFVRTNSGSYTSTPCTLSIGTSQNGQWNCPITGLTNSSAVSYYVTATDVFSNTSNDPTAGAGTPNLFTVGAAVVPAGTYSSISLSDGTTLAGDIVVEENLELGGIINAGANTVTFGCNAQTTGGGSSSYLIGTVTKQFCSTQAFTYPIGTAPDNLLKANGVIAPEYSPFTANVTAVRASGSALTVNVIDTFLPGSGTSQSASRFWIVDETGDLTADISFTYLNQDVTGDESDYKVLRRESPITDVYAGGTVNAATNTASAPNVSDFSGWAAGNLAPTAAGVDIGGRVLNSNGRGISRARLTLTATDGSVLVRQTNPFGFYRFDNLTAGENYILTVEDKTYLFKQNTRLIFAEEENLNVNFFATGRN